VKKYKNRPAEAEYKQKQPIQKIPYPASHPGFLQTRLGCGKENGRWKLYHQLIAGTHYRGFPGSDRSWHRLVGEHSGRVIQPEPYQATISPCSMARVPRDRQGDRWLFGKTDAVRRCAANWVAVGRYTSTTQAATLPFNAVPIDLGSLWMPTSW